MRVRVFYIRLTKENLQTDQNNLNVFMESVVVKKTSTELILGQPNFWSILVFYEELKMERHEKTSDKFSVSSFDELNETDKQFYEILKQWRQNKATELGLPSFMICHNTELMTIAKVRPQNLDELLKIKGFGGQKIAKFGDDIIAVLNSI